MVLPYVRDPVVRVDLGTTRGRISSRRVNEILDGSALGFTNDFETKPITHSTLNTQHINRGSIGSAVAASRTQRDVRFAHISSAVFASASSFPLSAPVSSSTFTPLL